jgi:DNA-binding transcriptional ArsR family regulator
MTEMWEFCRKLSNPERLGLFRQVCEASDCLNVGVAQEGAPGLKQSGTSQYLGQLWKMGLIRRLRSGHYVNYYADAENAHASIRDVAIALQNRFREESRTQSCDESYVQVMRVMGNAMRARIVGKLAREGLMTIDYICDRMGMNARILNRHLKPAIDAGLVVCDANGFIKLNRPTDLIAQLILKGAC